MAQLRAYKTAKTIIAHSKDELDKLLQQEKERLAQQKLETDISYTCHKNIKPDIEYYIVVVRGYMNQSIIRNSKLQDFIPKCIRASQEFF